MLPTIRRTGRSFVDSPYDLLGRDFNRFLDRWYSEPGETELVGSYPVDIREDGDHIFVEAEMPGFTKDQINVTLENGVLSISAQRKSGGEPQDKGKSQSHLSERRFTRVSRSFSLPTTVDESKVDAKLADGVLHLTLHKRDEVKPRRIEVK